MGDEGLFLIGAFDLDDRGGGELRLLGADDVQLGKARSVAGAEVDDLRALDEAARLEIDAIFTEMLTRMKRLRVLEPPQWLNSTFISGMTHMPIGFELR